MKTKLPISVEVRNIIMQAAPEKPSQALFATTSQNPRETSIQLLCPSFSLLLTLYM